MRLDPTSLSLFLTVVEEGSIAGAAQRGQIAAAAVSKRMSELEAKLRTQLLSRTNKGVEPTAAGLALQNLARRLLRDLDEIYVEISDYASGTRGQVRVHANISSITQFLPRELAAFLSRYPKVEVHLQERISSAITKAVAENAADVGFCMSTAPMLGLQVFPYHSDELVLITPRRHPIADRASIRFVETIAFDYVGMHTGSSINIQLTAAALEANKPLRLRMQVTSYDALALMVQAGLGIGAMPRRIAASYEKSLEIAVLKLDERWSRRELKICVRSFDALPEAAKRLVEELRGAD